MTGVSHDTVLDDNWKVL